MRGRWVDVVTVVVLAVTVAALVGDALLQVPAGPAGRSPLEHLLLELAFAAFVVNGLVLVRHRPANPVGWLLVAIGAAPVWLSPLQAWGEYRLGIGLHPGAVGVFGLWANGWYFWPLMGLLMFHLPLLFPDGRLPSRRWRAVTWFVTSAVVALAVMGMTAPRLVGQEVDVVVANPIGITWMPPVEGSAVGDGLFAVLLLGLGAGIMSLVVRFRRSHGAERQQLKWLLAAVSLLVVLPLSELVAPWVGGLLFPVVIACLPTAITVSVLRHRLWDIDRIISRTLAYALLVLLLAGTYLGVVLGLGALASAVTGGSGDVVVALSTLAAAAVFHPLRRRVRRVVDRRFNRARYDAAQLVASFGRDLRDQVSLPAIAEELRGTTTRALQPAAVALVLTGRSP